MIDYAFLVATSIYGAIGVAGYIMFGDWVSDEVCLFSCHKAPRYLRGK